ncbi:MAG: RluA family pseudouridine synthase [Bacillota bacterium]|nr:RluA family pseudouridine synthase [Bacillota bacterium]
METEAAGQRIDRWLAAQAELEASRSQVQRWLEEGRVQVDGRPVRASERLRAGSRVTVDVPAPPVSRARPEPIPLRIVYEDADLIVVDKPRGLVVHPAPGHPDGTLVNALLGRLEGREAMGDRERPGIVHRLDRETTGLLVVARNSRAFARLQAMVHARQMRREYLALVWLPPGRERELPARGRVEAPVGRDPVRRKRMAVTEGGRPAVTHFEVLERFPGAALLRLRLETGRTHQIRVHMAFAGFPVLADPVYGGRAALEMGRKLGLRGQALHAALLAFDHPVEGRPMRFEAPPPEDFLGALAALRRGDRDGEPVGPPQGEGTMDRQG